MSNQNNDLREKLHAKIYNQRVSRSNKRKQDDIVDKSLNQMGINKEQFEQSIKILKQAGIDPGQLLNQKLQESMNN